MASRLCGSTIFLFLSKSFHFTNTLIEQVVSLSEEEKIELDHVLQDNLNLNDAEEQGILEEVEARQKSIQDGTAFFISGDEFLNRLKSYEMSFIVSGKELREFN